LADAWLQLTLQSGCLLWVDQHVPQLTSDGLAGP